MNGITSFLASDIRTAVPILIAALGIVFSQRAGIVNIGIEGLMLIGSFAGVLGSYITGSVFLGTIVAVISSMLFALIFAFFTITIKADQTVVGTAINIIAGGLTIVLNRVIFGSNMTNIQLDVFDIVPIPILSKIPILGPSLFTQSIPVYIIFLLVPIAHFVL